MLLFYINILTKCYASIYIFFGVNKMYIMLKMVSTHINNIINKKQNTYKNQFFFKANIKVYQTTTYKQI